MKWQWWMVAFALCGLGCSDASRSEAEAAAASWTAGHAEGWTLEVDRTMPIEGFQVRPSYEWCTNGSFWINAQTGTADLGLYFNCPQNDVIDLAWLRANVRGYDLSPVPVSIDADGWKFVAYPTSSALTDGLTFDSWTNGRIALHIETPLFSVVGESLSDVCVREAMGADGGLADCFVTVPFEGPLKLSFNVPLDPTIFDPPVPTRR